MTAIPFLGAYLPSRLFMNITLITVGKTKIPFVLKGIEEYRARLSRYTPFEIIEIPDVRTTKSMTAEQQKTLEGEQILSRLHPSDFVILLDEHGRQLSSVEFAAYIEKLQVSGRKRAVFVVGGPYGFSPAVYSRGNAELSLSKMTFNHEMVRMFFVEQIYRAMTILRNEPYHHE